ncbi:MAG: response regulator [bacterium]|nr:response regulator [bacterium]
MRALVIEADPFFAKLYGIKLKKSGLDVDTVHNGEEALQKLRLNKYAVVLMNVMLPFQDGFTVLRKSKQLHKKMPPFVIVSSLRQKEDIDKALKLGAKQYFVRDETQLAELMNAVVKASGKRLEKRPVKTPKKSPRKPSPMKIQRKKLSIGKKKVKKKAKTRKK